MKAVLDLLDRMEQLPLETLVVEAAVLHADDITDLNKEQLDRGLDADGNDLGEYADRRYKGRLRPVDLKLTGDYRDSFNVEPFGAGFNIDATDRKAPFLQKRYGSAIQGLTEANKHRAGRIILTPLVNALRTKLL